MKTSTLLFMFIALIIDTTLLVCSEQKQAPSKRPRGEALCQIQHRDKQAALLQAVKDSNYPRVLSLLHSGAQACSYADNAGKTALDYATENAKKNTLNALEILRSIQKQVIDEAASAFAASNPFPFDNLPSDMKNLVFEIIVLQDPVKNPVKNIFEFIHRMQNYSRISKSFNVMINTIYGQKIIKQKENQLYLGLINKLRHNPRLQQKISLIDLEKNVNAVDPDTKEGILTIIINTLGQDRVSILEQLILFGANVNYKLASNPPPLYAAAQKINPQVIKLLLKYGADVNTQFASHTPLGTLLDAYTTYGSYEHGQQLSKNDQEFIDCLLLLIPMNPILNQADIDDISDGIDTLPPQAKNLLKTKLPQYFADL